MESRLLDLDPFSFRQFDDPKYGGTHINCDKLEFIQKVNKIVLEKQIPLKNGYAPFCKHVFIDNFTEATPGAVPITDETLPLIRTGYASRRSEELSVLSRWVFRKDLAEANVIMKPAKYLDLILYSKEQLMKEAEALPRSDVVPVKPDASQLPPAAESLYSIISIKAQDIPCELPMQPITMMRNTLISEGGSGVAIHREDYLASVEYWSKHCELR